MFERWASPSYFNYLWLVLLMWAVMVVMARRHGRNLVRVLGPKVAPLLTQSTSPTRQKWRWAFELSVLFFLVLGLARPQSGESTQKLKSEGVEVMFVVDVSQSMLAEDVRPSRLELTKQELLRFVEKAGGHKIGLVAFAGSSVLLSPLTTDKSAIQMFIESLSPIAVSSQGTDFKRALQEAKGAFERGGIDPGNEGVVGRLVVLVSDGEDNEKGAMDAAEELAKMGVRIFTLGVGTEAGAAIPLFNSRGQRAGYLQDKDGTQVITKATSESLKRLAEEGRGGFYQMTFGGDAIPQLLQDLDRMEKSEFDAAELKQYDERFQVWVFLALLVGLLEISWSVRKAKGRLWRGRFEVEQS